MRLVSFIEIVYCYVEYEWIRFLWFAGEWLGIVDKKKEKYNEN